MEILQSIGIGLVTGIGVYYATKLFFDPIIRYKETIFEIDKNLIYYANAKYYEVGPDGELDTSDSPHNQRVDQGKNVHRLAAGNLRAAYCHLPHIYKLYLKIKDIDPFAASRNLIGLSNTYKLPDDLRYDRDDRIRKHLRLFNPETGEQMSFSPGER